MKKELDDALCKDFPSIFKDRGNRNSIMQWGFSCNDGWYALIRNLCFLIMEDCKGTTEKPAQKPPVAIQVKEKFGRLRFYVKNATDTQRNFIRFAESMSNHICEYCGTTADVFQTTNGWVRTTCKTCEDLRIEKEKEVK